MVTRAEPRPLQSPTPPKTSRPRSGPNALECPQKVQKAGSHFTSTAGETPLDSNMPKGASISPEYYQQQPNGCNGLAVNTLAVNALAPCKIYPSGVKF